MMQECPRCGFLQPQDRFCANCGLDIENYRPSPLPWYRKVLANSTFQISVIVLTIGTMVAYISWQQSRQIQLIPVPEISDQIAVTGETTKTSKSNEAGSKPLKKGLEQRNHSKALQKTPSKDSSTAKTQENDIPTSTKETNPTVENEKLPQPTHLVVNFVEFPKESLNQIFSKAKILHEGTQIQVGVYTDLGSLKELTKKFPQIRELPGKTRESLNNSEIQVQFMEETSEEQQGLNLDVSISKRTSTGIELETSGILSLSGEESDQTINAPLDGNYSLKYSSFLIIAGLVPHRPLSKTEASAFNESPFEIMNSQEFLENETEFVILLYTD